MVLNRILNRKGHTKENTEPLKILCDIMRAHTFRKGYIEKHWQRINKKQ